MDKDQKHSCQLLTFEGIQNGEPVQNLQNSRLPTIEEGEILARIRLCTICGSDLHTLSGKRPCAVPSVLGHEAVAEVVTLNGRPADHLKSGDRITFSIADNCGRCKHCLGGLSQKCYELFKYGHATSSSGSGFNGCYASHIVLRKGTAVVKIPDHVSDQVAVPANCALATMMNVIASVPESIPCKDSTVVIQGAGTLGLYGCALFSDKGFNKVFCTGVGDVRLSLVTSFGGIPWNTGKVMYPSLDMDSQDNTKRPSATRSGYNATCATCPDDDTIGSRFPGDGTVDVVVEVCGVPSVVQDGIRLLRPGGVYILVGMVHPDSHLKITGQDIITKCLTIKGIYNYAPRHLRLAVEFLSRTAQKYPYEALVSLAFNLKDYAEAFRLAQSRNFHRVAMKSYEFS